MTELATITFDLHDDVAIACLLGEIDASNVHALEEEIFESVPNSVLGLVVDLSEVSYIDSAGVRLIFEIGRRLHDRRQETYIVVPSGARIRRVLEITRVEATVPILETVPEAVSQMRQAV